LKALQQTNSIRVLAEQISSHETQDEDFPTSQSQVGEGGDFSAHKGKAT
jgi:hypothetical protein